MTVDNYTAEYDAGETSEVVVDILIKIAIAIGSFATLLGLVMLYGWAKKKGVTKIFK